MDPDPDKVVPFPASSNPLIRSVRILSSGSGEVHPEHVNGSWMPRMWWVLTSRRWVRVPVQFFVIDHRDGLVVVDTGVDPAIATDPKYIRSPIGRFLLHRIFRFHIEEKDRLDRKLVAAGFAPADVCKALITHLHFDHVGGIRHIPQAELVVSGNEWRVLDQPHPEREWVFREHIQLPAAKWCPIEFAPTTDPRLRAFGQHYDVMGDGSIILLPTPGHTPGSMSVLILPHGSTPILLVGDLAYSVEYIMTDKLPGTGNGRVLRESYNKVRQLKGQFPDLIILPSHDPTAAEMLKSSPLAA